jgi:hypothetical protein
MDPAGGGAAGQLTPALGRRGWGASIEQGAAPGWLVAGWGGATGSEE